MVSPQTPFRALHTSSSTHAPGSGPPPPSATTSTHPPSLSSTAPHSAQSQSQSHSNTHAVPSAAPDSPRSSQSPTPEGFQGNLELELLGLANALYNLGTTVINDSTKERDRAVSISGLGERERGGGLGLGGGIGGKQVGLRVNQVVQHLNIIDSLAHSELDAHPEYSVYSEFDPVPRSGSGSGSGSGPENRIMIPFQILSDIDNARNPMGLTRERLERAATENQFMNGKIEGVRSYREYLNEALCLNFPDLEEYLRPAGA